MSDSAETIVQIVKELLEAHYNRDVFSLDDCVVVLEEIGMVVNQKTIQVVFDD